jgi:hypothetical protein
MAFHFRARKQNVLFVIGGAKQGALGAVIGRR